MAKAASKSPAKMPAKSKSSPKAKAAPAARKALAKRVPKPMAKAAAKPAVKPAAKSVSKAVAKAATKPVAPKVAAKPVPSKTASTKAAPVAAKAGKWVFTFGDGKADGKAEMRNLLGGKGANLAEMSNLGLPVPPGFTITSEVCTYYYRNNGTYPAGLKAEVETALAKVGEQMGAKFGDSARPLLVSVRSGARVS